MRGSSPVGRTVSPVVALLGLLVTGGCTMCPSPFDYAGPVPNGSAPQNDFRARSNGILPLGGQSTPWPPVVHAAPPSPQEPTPAPPQSVVVTAADDATWLVAAAVETDSDLPPTATEPEESAPVDEQPSEEATVEAAGADGIAAAALDLLPALEPAPRPEPPARVLRETEGWRSKR
jgi:hypothetical protein